MYLKIDSFRVSTTNGTSSLFHYLLGTIASIAPVKLFLMNHQIGICCVKQQKRRFAYAHFICNSPTPRHISSTRNNNWFAKSSARHVVVRRRRDSSFQIKKKSSVSQSVTEPGKSQKRDHKTVLIAFSCDCTNLQTTIHQERSFSHTFCGQVSSLGGTETRVKLFDSH